jgi:hypothetical protein
MYIYKQGPQFLVNLSQKRISTVSENPCPKFLSKPIVYRSEKGIKGTLELHRKHVSGISNALEIPLLINTHIKTRFITNKKRRTT